jgi:hypothetical protein
MKALILAAVLGLAAAGDSETVLCLGSVAQQNPQCCKAHKGICGCRAGKIVCCDKTFAEGCTCNSDEPLISL